MKQLLFFFITLFSIESLAQETQLKQAEATYANGDFDNAYVLFKKAGDLYFANEAFVQYIDTHLKMIDCQLQAGNPFHAKSLAENTLDFIETEVEEEQNLRARCLTLLGLSYLNLGRNDDALEVLLEGEGFFSAEDTKAKANCLDALGLVYTNNENKQLAAQYHEQAFVMRRKLFGAQSIEVANSYNNLGRVFLNSDPLQALIYFNRAKGIYEEKLGNSSRRALRANLNIAFANMEQNNYDEALEQLNDVKLIYDATYQDDHPNKAYIQSIIGRVYLLKEEYEKALLNQKEALQMYISLFGEKHPDVANTYYLIGEIYKAKSEFKVAVEFYQRAIYANLPEQVYTEIYDLPKLENYFNADILLRTLQAKAIALGALHFEKSLNVRDIVGAIETYQKCDDLITIIRRKRLNEQDKLRLGQIAKEVYESGIQLSLILSEQSFNRKKHLQTAFDFCERSKSSVLLEAITESKAKKFAGIPDEQIQLEDSLKDEISFLEQQLALQENADNREMKDLLFAYQNSYRAFIANLESQYPEYYKLKYDQQIATVASVQEHLTERAALLSYFIGENELYIFVITKKDVRAERRPKGADFQKMITGLRNAIKYNSERTFLSTARSLHSLIMPDFSSSIKELIILPDGILGTLPFEAFVSSGDETSSYTNANFLIEDFQISYDYSATLFTQRVADDEQILPEILLIAPISFEDNEVRMSNLPGSEKEIDEIRYLFMGSNCETKVQTGSEASESNFKSEDLGKYRYLHFATHGIVNESEPALSRIFLKPGNNEDGSLYTGEIYNLNINADLVTLSACETGLGKVAKGEGIVGLSRALQYAGANNIIVSLWQVADASTAQMMIEFYKYNLNNDHHGYNSALREAKLSLLNSEQYARPYYWAPFILVGM
ncbi:CHAT domain-containing protein [Ekhidna lutea]|uniref:CHAT domain-containing protein n=1 Tax=Ekhidna lutea TaxID=447679 RepID=A0A239M7A6_EKHLU|nr:CHAT domain-containing tetratricopeptide repeat protein [Ekhidna lutea]SNT38012.1 CHAT domain-containing protein [Ekhidna lutea]